MILALVAAVASLNVLAPTPASAWWRWPRPTNGAPEIAPDAIASALALITGGLALLGRRR